MPPRGREKIMRNVSCGIHQRTIRRNAVLAAAVIGAVGGASHALAQTRYWDVNGATPGSGVTNTTLDWLNDNYNTGDASGSWDNVTTFWDLDSTGGGAGG